MSGVVGKYPRTQMEVFAGTPIGDDARLGGLVEIKKNLVLADNAWILPTSRQITGESIRFEAKNVTIDGTSGFDATGRGYVGGAGLGGRACGHGGARCPANPDRNGCSGSGGFGGHGGAYAKEDEWGLEYGTLKDCELMPGSGGCGGYYSQGDWDGGLDYRRFGGAGGGSITLYVKQTLNLAGMLMADGESTKGNGPSKRGGGGSGGSVYVCCLTWNPSGSPVVRAQGGPKGDDSRAFGGGGGRVVIRRSVDTDPIPVEERTYATAMAGLTGSATADRQPTVGTVYWGRWGSGLQMIVK